ncbi:MAG: hypothetical protein ACJA0V_000284 [Planctomycetota bacterium]|jgi:hypothetical protein
MLTIVLPAALALSAPQGPETTTQLMPLQHICTHEFDTNGLPWGSLMRLRHNLKADLVRSDDGLGPITPDAINDALYGFVAEAIDAEQLFLQTIDNNLLVVGEPQLVARVRKYIAEAAGILARPMQVELCVWDAADREPCSSILDQQAFNDFAANRTPMWRAVSTASAGQPLIMESMKWSRYVRGIDIQVAQKKTMTSPATDHYGEGGSTMVHAFSLIGSSDFAVHMQFAVGNQPGVVNKLQTGMPGAPDIELPRLDSFFGTCSGRIPNGGALATSLHGNAASGGQITVTLRVTSTGSPAPLTDQRAALLPVGALISDGLNYQAALPDVHSEGGQISIEQASSHGRIPSDNLQDLIAGVLAAADEEGDHEIKIGGGYLYMRASQQGIQRAQQLIQTLQDELIGNVEIRHSAHLHALPGQPGNTTTRAMLHSLTLPTLLGREAAVYRLHETNIVANIFVEVASEAGSLAPSIELLQSGTWFRARVVPVGESLHASVDLLSVIAPIPAIRSVMPGGGVLMQAQISSARLDHDGILTSGTAIDHGDGPRVTLAGRTYRSKLATTFSR